MKTIINAGFYRISQRTRNRARQRMNVLGMEFDVPAEKLTGNVVAAHPKAPPNGDGWVLHGWCEAPRRAT